MQKSILTGRELCDKLFQSKDGYHILKTAGVKAEGAVAHQGTRYFGVQGTAFAARKSCRGKIAVRFRMYRPFPLDWVFLFLQGIASFFTEVKNMPSAQALESK